MPSPSANTENRSIRALLRRIGLDEREVDVYLALLPLKIARAAAVAKAAKQSRSHTYLVLRSLEEKGLVSELERGNILHFVVESPQSLLSYVRDREEELQALQPLVEAAIPQLKGMTSPFVGQPRVTMLHGVDGMKQVYRDVLPNDFCALFNAESMYTNFGRNVVKILFGKDAGLRGRDLLVNNAASKQWLREVKPNDNYQVRLLPKGMTFATDTNVSGDIMAIFAYDDEQTIIRIENQNIADAFRTWFEALWAMSKEP